MTTYKSNDVYIDVADDRYGSQLGGEFYTFQDMPIKLHEAIRFAEEKHRGQVRKSTEISYIIHPLEVLQILMGEQCGIELVMAGVLHDVVEDTDCTIEEIRQKFGTRTAFLVEAHTEKKRENGEKRPWKVRKTEALEKLKDAEREVRQLVLADSISNLRSMVYDYRNLGEALWDRFNASKEDIAWYYSEQIDILEDFRFDEQVRNEFWEINSLFKHLFVKYYALEDEENHTIYQNALGDIYALERHELVWKKVDTLPLKALHVSKDIAERIEDMWNEALNTGL